MSYIEFARWFGLVSILLSLGILFNLENARAMAKKMVDEILSTEEYKLKKFFYALTLLI